jgi:small-conductance mechanosensitive channel
MSFIDVRELVRNSPARARSPALWVGDLRTGVVGLWRSFNHSLVAVTESEARRSHRRRRKEAFMPVWLLVLIIVLALLFVFGGFGFARR